MLKKIEIFDGYTTEIEPSSTALEERSYEFVIENNVHTPLEITNLNLNGRKGFTLDFIVNRSTTEDNMNEIGQIVGLYENSDWSITACSIGNAEIEIDILSNGQAVYTTSNMEGEEHTGTFEFKLSRLF